MAGNKPIRIEEYVGRMNSGHSQLSVARMVAPGGWRAPGQRPELAARSDAPIIALYSRP
jgi:hypothetical protein